MVVFVGSMMFVMVFSENSNSYQGATRLDDSDEVCKYFLIPWEPLSDFRKVEHSRAGL